MKKTLFTLIFLALATVVQGQTLGTNTLVPEATCNSGVANQDLICASSADHQVATNPNNGTLQNISRTYYVTTNIVNSASPNFVNVTGLTWTVNMNASYHATCHIIWSSTVTGTANPRYQFTGPNAATLTLNVSLLSPVTLTTFATNVVTTYSTTLSQTTAVTPGQVFSDTIDFNLVNGTNTGTIQLQAGPVGSGTMTIFAGSNCVVQ